MKLLSLFRTACTRVLLAVALSLFNNITTAAEIITFPPFSDTAYVSGGTEAATNDAHAAWLEQAGSTPIYIADMGAWGNERAMVVPCNMPGQYEARCYYDHVFPTPVDLSSYKEFRIEIYVPDPAEVNRVGLYFESAAPYSSYFSGSVFVKAGWQTLVFSVIDLKANGVSPNWNHISRIRLSPWRGTSSVQTELAIKSFVAVPNHSVLLVKDSTVGGAFYTLTSQLLSTAYIVHDVVSQVDIENGYITPDTKMVILPDNSDESPAMQAALENFVAAGGYIMANHAVPQRIQALIGVTIGAYSSGVAGQYSSYQFSDVIIPNLPGVVRQNSWGIMQATTGDAHNSRVIANWNDYNNSSGPPAWIASDTGLYMSHVLLNDDTATKSQMLLSLLTPYVPQLLSWESASLAILDLENVGKYLTFGSAIVGVRNNEPMLPPARAQEVEIALTNAIAARSSALIAQHESRYADAIANVKQARALIQGAYAKAQLPGSPNEFRAVWSSEAVGPYPGDWSRAANELANNGFNAVSPNVATGGVAHYGSALLPHSDQFAQYGDQLQAAVTAGHAVGVKVFAWDIVWAMQGASSSWISDMQTQDRLMQRVVADTASQLSLRPLTNPNWLSPCDDRNRQMIKNALLEMANNYDIDGIHLDYIRSNGSDSLYEMSCKSRFETETNNRVLNWPTDVWNGGALKAAYDQWKPTVITSFVKEVHDALVSVNESKLRLGLPRVTLAAAVFSDPVSALSNVAQDWPDWIAQGAIDALHPMDYFATLTDFNTAVANQSAIIANRIPFYPGIGVADSLRPDEMIARTSATRGDNPKGIVTNGFIHFAYSTDFANSFLPPFSTGMTSNKTASVSDLALAITSAPMQPLPGSTFDYKLTIKNRGSDTANNVILNDWLPAGATLQVISMSQGQCDAAAASRIQCALGQLLSGGQATVQFTLSASALGIYVNDASVSSDSTDPTTSDNTGTASVVVASVDLVPVGFSATQSGALITVSDAVKNVGSGSANAFDVTYYFSTDATLQVSVDVPFCSRRVESLGAGSVNPATGTASIQCAVPNVTAGTYYIIAKVDSGNEVPEVDELNNISLGTIGISGVDIVPTAVTASRSGTNKILVGDTVKNQGSSTAGSFTVKYYLSTNATYESGVDIALASASNGTGSCSRSLNSLKAGVSSNVSNKTCYKPAGVSSGVNYYVLAVSDADNKVVEYNEGNNSAATGISIHW